MDLKNKFNLLVFILIGLGYSFYMENSVAGALFVFGQFLLFISVLIFAILAMGKILIGTWDIRKWDKRNEKQKEEDVMLKQLDESVKSLKPFLLKYISNGIIVFIILFALIVFIAPVIVKSRGIDLTTRQFMQDLGFFR